MQKVSVNKDELDYIKSSIEWLNKNTRLLEDNRTNAEHQWCCIYNSLDLIDRANEATGQAAQCHKHSVSGCALEYDITKLSYTVENDHGILEVKIPYQYNKIKQWKTGDKVLIQHCR